MVGGCCPVPESAGKGMNLTAFWVGFIKLMGKNKKKSLMPPDVVAAPVPPPLSQPRASPSSPPALMVTTVPSRPQKCCVFIWLPLLPRTAPGHSLTSKFQPSPFPYQPIAALPSSSHIPVHIPHSQSWFPS